MKKITITLMGMTFASSLLVGCTNTQVGTAAGAAAGAGLGYAVTGSGVGAAVGAGAGGLLGNAIGRNQDKRDYYYGRSRYYY